MQSESEKTQIEVTTHNQHDGSAVSVQHQCMANTALCTLVAYAQPVSGLFV